MINSVLKLCVILCYMNGRARFDQAKEEYCNNGWTDAENYARGYNFC